MTKDQIEILNITQQTLRAVLMALVSQGGINPRALSIALDAAGAEESLEPAARAMLQDLSEGMRMLGDLQSKSGTDGVH